MVVLCVEMLLDPSIAQEDKLIWRADPGPPFSEQNSGTWWYTAEKKSGACPNYEYELMPLILYTDGASPDFRRSTSLKPVVVQCGNFIGDVTRSNAGKRCAGFWPKIKV